MATEISMSHRIGQIHREIIALNQPTLNTPEYSIKGPVITVDNKINGNFPEGYRLYLNDTYFQDIPLDFTNLENLEYPEVMNYNVSLSTYGTYFNDSPIGPSFVFSMRGYKIIENKIQFQVDYETTPTKGFLETETIKLI